MTVHGIIDCRLAPPIDTGNVYNEGYVSTFNFLQSAYAQSLGIELVAYYNGSGGTGTDYWDNTAARAQTGAFSVWKFASASLPFYMLMSYNTSNNPAVGNSNPCMYEGQTFYSGLAWAFACREDGGNPWNGTTNKNGSDTKGTPVWTPGASNLFVWPRSNSTGGAQATNKENMMTCPFARNMPATRPGYTRFHFICDENNVVIMADDGLDSSYHVLYFGKYTPRSGSNPVAPYVCLRNQAETNHPVFPYASYGPATSNFQYEGGVAHPHAAASGTRSVTPDYCEQAITYVQFAPTQVAVTPSYPEVPIHIAMSEGSNMSGYLGYIDFVKFAYGMASNATSKDRRKAYFGSSALQATKLVVPWDGMTIPGTTYHRSGVMF